MALSSGSGEANADYPGPAPCYILLAFGNCRGFAAWLCVLQEPPLSLHKIPEERAEFIFCVYTIDPTKIYVDSL